LLSNITNRKQSENTDPVIQLKWKPEMKKKHFFSKKAGL
jgi:hypothetical protein